MRFAAYKLFAKFSTLVLGVLAIAGAFIPSAHAQTAPYVLPYTMTTYAGPHASYTAGAACGSGVSLDIIGTGCIASLFNVGPDPHDIRVDALGNIYFMNNNGASVITKINAKNGITSVLAGSASALKVCANASDAYGDGCPANDGAANTTTTSVSGKTSYYYTSGIPKARGLGIAPNGDVYFAGYNSYIVSKISASTGIMSLVAGLLGGGTGTSAKGQTGYLGDGGPATSAAMNGPRGVGPDAHGNVYIADTGNSVIRRVDGLTGVMSTFAGGPGCVQGSNASCTKGYTGDGGPANLATLSGVEDVQVDSFGNVYIADAGNNVLRVVYAGGTVPNVTNPVVGNIYTVAGGGSTAYNGVPVLATSIAFTDRKIALDEYNNVYIADSSNSVVWFLDHSTGYIRIIAGTFGVTTLSGSCAGQTNTVGDGCIATSAVMNVAGSANMGVSPDAGGNLYITDSESSSTANSRIRKVVNNQTFPSVAFGSSVSQTILIHFAVGDTPAATNAFTISNGNSDYSITGTPACVLNGDGTTDCTVAVRFSPTLPGIDNATLKVNTTLGATTSLQLTGQGTVATVGIDPGVTALLPATVKAANGVAVDAVGNAVIADTGNNRVLYYNALTATTSVIAGSTTAGYTGDNGAATSATLNAPKGVAFDAAGNIYIADTGNNAIRRINVATGIIKTIGGGTTTVCTLTSSDALGNYCPATQAILTAPSAIAVDGRGNIYVADNTSNPTLRVIGSNGYIYTIGGGATTVCAAHTDTVGDGCAGTTFMLGQVGGMQFDGNNNLFIADTSNNLIRQFTLGTRLITAVAGTGQAGATISSNSIATLSQLNGPTAVGVDASDDLYIADTGNHAIRLVTAGTGTISTVAGILTANGTGTLPGAATKAQLNAPGGIAVSGAGTLYISDTGNNRVFTDMRGQISYNFGRTNVGFTSPVVPFIELATGSTAATLGSPLFTATGNTSVFTLTSSGSAGCTPGQTLTVGTTCTFSGQFVPTVSTAPASTSAVYTELGTNVNGVVPSVTLTGIGAVLTSTSTVITKTFPATGNPQFGGTLTLSATVTPASCNTAAPSCFPTGTITFYIDGIANAPVTLNGAATASQNINGLSVGSHTAVVVYSGDDFYASNSSASFSITVTTANTTTMLAIAPSSTTQFSTVLLTATVAPVTSAPNPAGTTVSFYANGTTLIGTAQLDASGLGTAVLTSGVTYAGDGTFATNNTLPPGTYAVTASFPGSANYSASVSTGVTLTVTADPVDFITMTKPCKNTAIGNQAFVPSTSCGNSDQSLANSTKGAQPVNDPSVVGKSSTGTAGGNITSYLVCPLSSSINFGANPPKCTVDVDASTFLYKITFWEPNTFTAGQVVTVSGFAASSSTAATSSLNLPYTVLSATSTYWTAALPTSVGTAQGSTVDVTIFVQPSNTLSGTLTFSCSGMPANSVCTFSPTTYALTPGTTPPVWVPITMTLWTDIQAGTV
ncbi:MAG: Ig-like domain repeat protein, partial [Acidobacteriaceae bacterium]|nr:Ig-like domain repeat protein [Acidobacteriaceae bacterium]